MPYMYDPQAEDSPTDYSQIHEKIQQWIQEERKEHGDEETENGKILKKKGLRQAAYIFKEGVLEQILSDTYCDIGHYLQWAKENNKLYTGKDPNHKYKCQTQIDGSRKWCYMIFLPN